MVAVTLALIHWNGGLQAKPVNIVKDIDVKTIQGHRLEIIHVISDPSSLTVLLQ